MLKFLYPAYYVPRVTELTLSWLTDRGIRSLLLDADCTLKRYTQEDVDPDIRRWLDSVRAGGIGLRLVSNGLGERIGALAARLDIPFTAKALKPFPAGIKRAMAESGFDPKSTAMTGDQLFADILAGNWAHITSILVDPIHPEEEHWFTRIKRPPERWLLRRMRK